MTQKQPYGTPWTYEYFPHIAGEARKMVSTDFVAYIFEERPDEDSARNGTGALETISAVTVASNKYSCTFTVSAIDHPQDGTESDQYWIAINFKFDGGTQLQLDLQSFWLYAPDGQYVDPSPSVQDAKDEESSLIRLTDIQIKNDLRKAERKVEEFLTNRGFDWARIENPEDLKHSILYRALMDMMLDLVKDEGDRWHLKYSQYKEDYEKAITELKIQYDADQTRDITPDEAHERIKIGFLKR